MDPSLGRKCELEHSQKLKWLWMEEEEEENEEEYELKLEEESNRLLLDAISKHRNVIYTLKYQCDQFLVDNEDREEEIQMLKLQKERIREKQNVTTRNCKRLENSINDMQRKIDRTKVLIENLYSQRILPLMNVVKEGMDENEEVEGEKDTEEISKEDLLEEENIEHLLNPPLSKKKKDGPIRDYFPNKSVERWKKFDLLFWLKDSGLFPHLYHKMKMYRISSYDELLFRDEDLIKDSSPLVQKLFKLNLFYLRRSREDGFFYSRKWSRILLKLTLKSDFRQCEDIYVHDFMEALTNRDRLTQTLKDQTPRDYDEVGFSRKRSDSSPPKYLDVFIIFLDSNVTKQNIEDCRMSEVCEIETFSTNPPYYCGVVVGQWMLFFDPLCSITFPRLMESKSKKLIKRMLEGNSSNNDITSKSGRKRKNSSESNDGRPKYYCCLDLGRIRMSQYILNLKSLVDTVIHYNIQKYDNQKTNCVHFVEDILYDLQVYSAREYLNHPLLQKMKQKGYMRQKPRLL